MDGAGSAEALTVAFSGAGVYQQLMGESMAETDSAAGSVGTIQRGHFAAGSSKSMSACGV